MTSITIARNGLSDLLDWHDLSTLFLNIPASLGSSRKSRIQRDLWIEQERANRPPSDDTDNDNPPPDPEPPHTPSDWLED